MRLTFWDRTKRTDAPKRGARRKTRGRLPRPRTLLRLAALALAVVGAGAGAWLWYSGDLARAAGRLTAQAYVASADAGLAIGDVLVEGRKRTAPALILEAVGVERGTPIFAFDLQAAKRRLEALPWVRQAAVERRLPDIIYLRLTEREPMALWQLHDDLSVIDQGGEIISGAEARQFADLMLVVGEDAPRHTAALLRLLEREPELAGRVISAVRVSGRRWNLRLQGGVDVRLPEIAAAEAWTQLAQIEREHGLLARDVVMVDLRLPDRLVVRTTSGELPSGGLSDDDKST